MTTQTCCTYMILSQNTATRQLYVTDSAVYDNFSIQHTMMIQHIMIISVYNTRCDITDDTMENFMIPLS